MKKLFFILLFSFMFLIPLEAQWCGCPCTERYYNPSWANGEGLFYGYTDINDYPYSLPVNYYFNPRPCPNVRCNYDYNYFLWCHENSEPQVCPKCNGYH